MIEVRASARHISTNPSTSLTNHELRVLHMIGKKGLSTRQTARRSI